MDGNCFPESDSRYKNRHTGYTLYDNQPENRKRLGTQSFADTEFTGTFFYGNQHDIVLHKKTAEILFDKTHTEPIGQFVNAGNVVYQVVGLYNDKGDSGDSDAYIPFTTLQTIYNKGDKLNNLVMTTKNLETIALWSVGSKR